MIGPGSNKDIWMSKNQIFCKNLAVQLLRCSKVNIRPYWSRTSHPLPCKLFFLYLLWIWWCAFMYVSFFAALIKNLTNQNRLGNKKYSAFGCYHSQNTRALLNRGSNKNWKWNDVADEDIDFALGSQYCWCCCWLCLCCLKMFKNDHLDVEAEGKVNFCNVLQMFKICWLAVRFSSCVCFIQVSSQVSCAMFFCWYTPPSLLLVYGSSLFSFHQSCC